MPHARRQSSPVIRRPIRLAGFEVARPNAVGKPTRIVGINVTVVEGGHTKTRIEQVLGVDPAEATAHWRAYPGIGPGVPTGPGFDPGIVDRVLHGAEIDTK